MKLTLDGMMVELDLTAKHAAALRSAFRKYLDAGKVVAPNGTRPRGKA
jgi:tRNA threonylcarbamoyladenosine modification (KEOPS) complex  Pcc1 subunit